MINETQYNTVHAGVGALLYQSEFDYLKLVGELEALIRDGYGALNTATNPAVVNLPEWDETDISFLVQEYSGFTNESIHMFHDADIRLEWTGVKTEIARNLSEEMGVLTGIPHLELMRRGYREDLGVETVGIELSASTTSFLARLRHIFRSNDNAYLCGGLLAFEATATYEFKGVAAILRSLKQRQGGEITADSLTGRYIAGHVAEDDEGGNYEDEHYWGMRDAIGRYITAENYGPFVQGFIAVCTALNVWWEQLSIEVYSRKVFLLAERERQPTANQRGPALAKVA